MKNRKTKRGMSILGVIVFAVLVILILSYFKVSIKSIVESPAGQENINYVGEGAANFWNSYLKEPATNFWNFFTLKINKDSVDYNNLPEKKPN